MQSNDDLYSTDTNPVIAAYEGFNKEQPETNTPGEMDKGAHKIMPITSANETASDDRKDGGTDNEEDVEDEEDLEEEDLEDEEDVEDATYIDDAGLDANADTTADDTDDEEDDEDGEDDEDEEEGTGSALNKNMSVTNADDKGGIY